MVSSECALGYNCQGPNKTSATCKKFCSANSECGTPRGRCAITVSSNAQVPKVCSSNCDPSLTTDMECPPTFKCGLFAAGDADVLSCTPAGTRTQGGDCKSGTVGDNALCAKGYRCSAVSSGVFQCRRICKMNAPNCTGGLTCNRPFSTPFVVDVEYGHCS